MAEHEAATLSLADVRAAAALCDNGDTLVLPTGNVNWTTSDSYHVSFSKHVSIQGQGTSSTIITNISSGNKSFFRWMLPVLETPPQIEVQGLKLYGYGSTSLDSGLRFYAANRAGNLKIHNVDCEDIGFGGIIVEGYSKGVIYDCNFINCYYEGYGYGVSLQGTVYGEEIEGTWVWTTWPANTDPGWGTDAFLFIEDCYFSGCRHSISSDYGAKYVFRHNTSDITYYVSGAQHVDMHGKAVGYWRGVRAAEVYENSIGEGDGGFATDGFVTHGGDCLVYNNVFGPRVSDNALIIADSNLGTYPGDYPDADQMRGGYFWGNTSTVYGDVDNGFYPGYPHGVYCELKSADFVQNNRDVFLYAPPSYTPYTYPHPLRGEAPPADPEINIQYNSINISDGNTYNFGFRAFNSNTDQIFTLGNIGDGDLTLSGTPIITITGTNADQFSVQAQPSTPIAGFSNTTFTLRFTPTSLGLKTAAISIVNNDADENPYDIVLNGTGVENIYYVDQTDGNDSWDGLAPEYVSGTNGPWKTIAQVNGSSFLAGDTILFQCGETWREQLTVPSSGSDGSPITFGAYGTGAKPKIYGSTAVVTWTDEGSDIWYATCTADPLSVWFINTDTTIHGGKEEALKASLNAEYEWWWDDPNDRLYVYAATDPDARYTSVENATRNGGISFSAQSYITVQDIEIAYTKFVGISVGSNSLVQGCTVHHVNIVGAASLSDGITLTNVSSSTVSDCDIYEIGRHGIYAVASSGGTCSNNIIEHSTLHNCYHTLIDVMNVDGTASGNITRYNLLYTDSDYADASFGCMGIYYSGDTSAEYPQVNGEIYYNVSFNMFSVHIGIGKYTTGTQVLNNSCYGTNPLNTTKLANGISLGNVGATTITAKNNIAMDIYSGAGGGDACIFVYDVDQISAMDNNCWYQSAGGTQIYARLYDVASYHYDDFAAWKTALGKDANSLWEDPLMTDPANGDLTPQSGSPCINAGVDVGLTEDYAGNPIVGLPDIGAYEYPGGAVTAVTIFFGCNF